LRPGYARHQFHRKKGEPLLGERLEPRPISVRVENGGDDGAPPQRFGDLGFRPADAEQDIGVFQRRIALADLGAGPGKGVIRYEGTGARPGFNGNVEPLLHKGLDRIGGRRNAALARMRFGRDRDLHMSEP
jgi:hypothetical protein